MEIVAVHHVGIRVTDERRSVEFYSRLGFAVVYRDQHDPVVILKNAAGVEINLIVNAAVPFDGKNRLMDVPEKFPGYTHVALRVSSMDQTEKDLAALGIAVTEGPRRLGPGVSLFVRDPDANVLELRQDLP
jgi:lactoylglutathione lyase